MLTYRNSETGQVLNEQQFQQHTGGNYKILGYAPTYSPPQPQKSTLEKIGGGLDAVFGGKQIGQSLVNAGTNAYNLATGGKQKFMQNLPQNTTNVPALIGDYAKAGATAFGMGAGPGLAAPVKPGILGGALQGVKTGAIGGGAFGALQGGTDAMKNQQGVGDVLKGTLEGGLTGAAGGALLGGVTGGIGGGLKSRTNSINQFAEDFVSPKQTNEIKADAISKGHLQDPSLFKPASIGSTPKDVRLADSVRDVVSPKASLGENINAINHKIATTNNGVKSYISQNKVPFNANQLRTRLMGAKEDSKLIFASDATAEKTYDAVVNEFMKNVQRKDTAGLFAARQNFDKIPAIKKLLDSRAIGENVKKSIVLDVRRAANEYVADQLPEGNSYRDLLRQESHMIEALGNAADKGASIIGKNGIQLLTEKYPILKWIVGGLAGAGGIGVGGAIIGSTD